MSISIPLSTIVSINIDTSKPEIRSQVRDEFPMLSDFLMSYPDWQQGKGNRIFDRSIRSSLGGFHIFWNPTKPFSLVEIEGHGVQQLRSQNLLRSILRQYSHLLTRLDLAEDWQTDVRPHEFVQQRDENRFKFHSEITSETGETCYVGSKTSDRFCRVYRYNPPHPRSGLLRAEFQFKGQEAKGTAELLQSYKLSTILDKLYTTFAFHHSIIQPHAHHERILSSPRYTKMGSTERWLFSQVLPACKKLIDNGQTDIVDIFGKKLYAMFSDRLVKQDNIEQIISGE